MLGEQVLRTRWGSLLERASQLTHLTLLMSLPSVSVGIIPADAARFAVSNIGFWIFDTNTVALETPTAAIKVTRPAEIAKYIELFEQLRAEAIYGAQAKHLVASVIAEG